MELEERALSRSTARQTTSSTATAAMTTSKTGLTSSVADQASVSSTAASVSGGRGSAREEVKADMLFNVDKGNKVLLTRKNTGKHPLPDKYIVHASAYMCTAFHEINVVASIGTN